MSGPVDFSCLIIPNGSRNRPRVSEVMDYNLRHGLGLSSRRQPCSFALARHHVIPFNVLRDFFNLLFQQSIGHRGISFQLGDFISKILVNAVARENAALGVSNDPTENLANLRNSLSVYGNEDELYNGIVNLFDFYRLPQNPLDLANIVINGRLEDAETVERMKVIVQAALSWMPFNLFEGPSGEYRSDDPGDEFEENAALPVGEENLNALRRAYDRMRSYVQNSVTDTTDVRYVFENLNEVRLRSPNGYGPYSPDEWIEEQPIQKRPNVWLCRFHIRPLPNPSSYPNRVVRYGRHVNNDKPIAFNKDPFCLVTAIKLNNVRKQVDNIGENHCANVPQLLIDAFNFKTCQSH